MEHAYRGTRLQKCNRRYYLLKRAKPHRCTLNRFKVTECIMQAVANCFVPGKVGTSSSGKRLVSKAGTGQNLPLFEGKNVTMYGGRLGIVLPRIQLVFVTVSGLVGYPVLFDWFNYATIFNTVISRKLMYSKERCWILHL